MEILSGLAVLILASALVWYNSAGPRRRRLQSRLFPPAWENYLQANVALYVKMPQALREQLRGHIQVFLGEKYFEGCGGLAITDEIRVTIAAQACLLLLNRPPSYYPALKAILVYPTAYVVKSREREVRLGESWNNGTIVLSWCDVNSTAHHVRDGHNLVLHEFAHQLDPGDGVPVTEQQSRYYHWAEVLHDEYQHLVALTEAGRRDVLQAYGATNPAEFFAVATEAFFEKPGPLQAKHPELYDQLQEIYCCDPRTWK